MSADVGSMIKKALKKKAVYLGSKKAINAVLRNEANKVVVSFNCPKKYKEDVRRCAEIAGIEVQEFLGTGVELGAVCGKPFGVAMLALKVSEAD